MTLTNQMVMIIIPVLLLHFTLIGIAMYQLFRNGCKNLSKGIWIIIILFIQTFGPIAFLLFGRDDNDRDY